MDREIPVDSVINLRTHIDDVVRLVETENLAEIYLLGHSYAGMVITGAAERLRGKVKGLLYFDAMVPGPGERLWDALSPEMRDVFLSVSFDGYRVFPDAAFQEMRPRVVPHPLPTYLEPVQYEPTALDVETKIYVLAAENNPSPFQEIAKRLMSKDDWNVITVPYGHDMFVDGPERMLEIITEALA
jgi:pimeloyl-ACP methyl ester carboxylesterase